MHKCNMCGKEMQEVSNIEIKGIDELKGIRIRGWRCSCGNEHSNSDDVDVLVNFYRAKRKGLKATIFKSGNSIAIRLPKGLVEYFKLKPSSKLNVEIDGDKIIFTS